MHPKDAAIEACKRIKANTVEKRLLDRRAIPISKWFSTSSTPKAATPV
jgi:hypothetical protein